jgi:hypothetical protein
LLFLFAHFRTAGPRPAQEGGSALRPASLATLLAGGSSALRFEPEGPWRATTPAERARGLRHAGGYLGLATPAAEGAELCGAEGWSVALRPRARLTVTPVHEGLVLALLFGRALVSNGELERELDGPCELLWREGDFVDRSGHSWTALAAASEVDPGRGREALAVDADLGADGGADEGAEVASDRAASGATLHGSVRRAPEGAPLAAFEVSLLEDVALPQVAFPTTRPFESTNGDFSWEELEAGTYAVFVSVPGAALWKRTGQRLVPGETLELEVEVEAGGSLRGFVVDAGTGAAIEGALIVSEDDMPLQVVPQERAELPPSARALAVSRRDGSFELEHLNLGPHRLRASGAGRAPTWIDVRLDSAALDGLLFELSAGGAVEGRCEHADGRPLERALVILSRYSSGALGGKMTYSRGATNERGRYRVSNLAPGPYVALLFTEQKEALRYQPTYKPVAVLEGRTARVDFLGEQRGASVSGVVRDAGGAALAFANLQLWMECEGGPDWQGETADEGGRYEFSGLAAGRYGLYAGTADSMALVGAVELGEGAREERDVVLQGRSFNARVFDDESQVPLAFIDLFLVDRGGAGREARVVAHAFSKTGGEVLFENLELGEYELLAIPESGGHAWAIKSGVRVSADAPGEVVDMYLERACASRVQVVDADGAPLSGATIELVSPLGEVWDAPWTPTSDDQGRIELERLRPGDWTLRVRLEGHLEGRGLLTAKAGIATQTHVVLLPR